MENFQVMWDHVKDIYEKILFHPFIAELREGSLSEDRFRFYILQDYLYLKSFGRAVLNVANKCEYEWMIKLIKHVEASLSEERQLHIFYIANWKVEPEEWDMSPTNLAYTNFLLAETQLSPLPQALAAIMPCYVIYMKVGEELSRDGSPNPVYQRWINNYSATSYRESVEQVINLMNSLRVDDFGRVLRNFRIASVYEYLFWDSSYRMERFPFPVK
ncbi:thiaminase II [Sulfolobales archaeon HS-7]|nr:thiaminase II [Sulfolobales archaeon HS-7]